MPEDTLPATALPILPVTAPSAAGYTYQQADGNRYVLGKGTLPQTPPRDIPLAGAPQWVAAAAVADGVVWAVVLTDGRTQGFYVRDGQTAPLSLVPAMVNNIPPMLLVQRGEARLMIPPTSRHGETHPVIIDQAEGIWAFIYADGSLNVMQQTEPILPQALAVNALPDARILVDEQQRLLLLTDPSERYAHAVLGDNLEATSITLLRTQPETAVSGVIYAPEPFVIEGIAPIWTDLNGDGQREIIVTLSSSDDGAEIVVYNEAGETLAVGPAAGQGFRWRHQIAVAPFGPDGELELAAVLTPHLDGVVEFYQWQGSSLQIVANLPGYTSHVMGTRNLDMAAAADFDGDGRVELLLPTPDRLALGAVQHTANGAATMWTLPLPAPLQSNLAVVQRQDGEIVVAAGLANGTLRLWEK
ncbi:MAG: hypothetical protein Fur0021_26100 [Candidatus Promineifilaceae bacterium]